VSWLENLELRFKKSKNNSDFVGASVLVFEKDNFRSINLGSISIDHNSPVDLDSPFELGSITKIFTALIFIKIHLSESFNLNNTIGDVLKNITNKEVADISILELLTHTSGVPRLPANMNPENYLDPYKDYFEDDLYNFLNSIESLKKEYMYSNLGYAILGIFLEKYFGKTIESILQEMLLLPLNMNSTTFEHSNFAKRGGDSRSFGRFNPTSSLDYESFQISCWPYLYFERYEALLNGTMFNWG
jgi:serine-type D-Ala-D-Ala carboxypeptidase/endopeptidase